MHALMPLEGALELMKALDRSCYTRRISLKFQVAQKIQSLTPLDRLIPEN